MSTPQKVERLRSTLHIVDLGWKRFSGKATFHSESLIARELLEGLLAGQHVSSLFCHGDGSFGLIR
jgi:hypothetical protein